ncbi:MAG TPA: DUF2630 family protein [Anaerolineae bacterium]|nr:DUF2630 family protein [Anaerolineae bacterium]
MTVLWETNETTMERINRLANERLALLLKASHEGLTEDDVNHLHRLDAELAQLWDRRRTEMMGKVDALDLIVERSYSHS